MNEAQLDRSRSFSKRSEPKVTLGGIAAPDATSNSSCDGMDSMKRLTFLTIVLAFSCLQSANSQEVPQDPKPAGASESDWYYDSTGTRPVAKPLGRQKAEMRAMQRQTRLASMRWYGFSANRPTAAALPFTTAYSPSWTRPGGRPFAWYISHRPVAGTPYFYYR